MRNDKETHLMNTDMDMTHTDGEEMDAGASDLFSRDTTGLPRRSRLSRCPLRTRKPR